MNETKWFGKYLQRSPAHPPITLPYSSPGHILFWFPFWTFYSLFLFPSLLENLACLTYHPQTLRNSVVESRGRGFACTGFAMVNYLKRAEGEGYTHAGRNKNKSCKWISNVGVYEAGSCSPSTNLSCLKGSLSLLQPCLPTPDAVLVTGQSLWLWTWPGIHLKNKIKKE